MGKNEGKSIGWLLDKEVLDHGQEQQVVVGVEEQQNKQRVIDVVDSNRFVEQKVQL